MTLTDITEYGSPAVIEIINDSRMIIMCVVISYNEYMEQFVCVCVCAYPSLKAIKVPKVGIK